MSMTAIAEEQKAIRFVHLSGFREVEGVIVNDQAGTARVIIITEGLGNLRDRNYYSKGAVESCVKVFEGKQFYVDHPSREDEENRPERSMRDLAGYFYDTALGEAPDLETGEHLSACFATLKFAMESEPGRLAFAQVKAAIEYQRRFSGTKDVYCGISINGGGVSHPDEINGLPVNMVTEIREAFSADIVTKPARGGKFLSMFAEAAKLGEFRRQVALGVAPVDAARRAEEKAMNQQQLSEARRVVADEAKKRIMTDEGLKGVHSKIGRLVAAINEPPEDPDDLIADIQGDVDALGSLLDDLRGARKTATAERKAAKEDEKAMKKQAEQEAKAAENEKGKTAEGETKAGEAENKKAAETEGEKQTSEKAAEGAKTSETEDEKKKTSEGEDDEDDEEKTEEVLPASDEKAEQLEPEEQPEDDENMDDDNQLGMRTEPKEARMAYTCAACAAENEVVAPKGYRLVAAEDYSTESQKSHTALVARLRKALEAKEARFMKQNEDKRNLMQELIQLRAENTAFKRTIEARKRLKEAGIPRDVLAPKDLLVFEPHQWESQIKAAGHTLAKEAALVNKGGNPAKDAGVKGNDVRGADAAIKIFKESAGLK